MSRESGVARINQDIGRIDTAREPKPVRFDPRNSKASDGSSVYFWRVTPNSDWADRVVLASEVDALVSAARPAAGFTARAEAHVLGAAARFVAQSQLAPTPGDGEAHLEFARERMAAVASAMGDLDRPVGVATVRSLLP